MFGEMSSKPGFWRNCRIAFRCARFTVWGIVLLALAAFAWLNVVGLPGFLKTRLVTALHQRGVQLEFTRMRLRIVHGLICDNVRIGAEEPAGGPVLTAREVQLRVNFAALLHGRLQVDGLVVRRGNFKFPLAADDSLSLTNLESELRFEADDTWALDQFHADFAGATFQLGGEVAHAPEFSNWKMFSSAKTADRGSVEPALRSFSDTLKQIHFEGKPQLNARLNGDARDVHSFSFNVNARAPGVQTPWFSVRDLEFAAHVLAPTNAPSDSDPAWGFWTNLQPFHLDWTARGTDLKLAGLNADAVDCRGAWNAPELAVTTLSVRLGGGGLAGNAKLDVATRELNFTVNSDFDPHAVAALLPDKARGQLAEISWPKPPQLNAGGMLVLPVWTNRAPDWGDDIETSLRLHGDAAFTNALVAGGARLDSVQTHFSYANRVWRLPDVALVQGRTTLDLAGEENDATKDFRCVLGGKLDAESLRPFLTTTNAARGFGHLFFREPAALVLDVRGNLRDFATLSATGRVMATDFAIRGQWVDSVITTLAYTNLTAEFYHPQLTRADGTERFAAEKVTLDLAGQRLFIHHGAGHVSPVALGEAIGPKTAEAMKPYQFLTIPEATADGCIPLKHAGDDLINDDADIRFEVIGTVPFRWRRFETPRITGTIHWLGDNLILTNVVSECYGGEARGWGSFDVATPGDGTDFSFFMAGTNVDFNAMGRALWSPTNELRGWLSGNVTVTSANSSDWRTWNGYGQAQLRDGLLWDAPIFGLMSPLLNTLTPGLDMGDSRATDGGGRFTMTNGVIFTDSLEIRSLTMRVQYVGTIDLDENVSARAKAQLLRNTPVLGSLFSMVLSPVSKAFECGITGTLDQPKITPVYIPFSKVLTAPLHPIRTVEEMFSAPPTNAPAKP
jgi:hypothetical protein